MCSAGDDAVNQDMVDQGAIDQLVGMDLLCLSTCLVEVFIPTPLILRLQLTSQPPCWKNLRTWRTHLLLSCYLLSDCKPRLKRKENLARVCLSAREPSKIVLE